MAASRTKPDYIAAAELRAALRSLTRATEEIAARHELTPRRYELLLFIQAAADAGAPATVTALCEPLQTTQASVTQLVEGAVRAGLVRRTPSPSDRRSHHLHVTARGGERLARVYADLGAERDRIAAIADAHFPR